MNANPEMLDFLKAMSDADRLRIIGLLTQRRASRADIVAKLNLPLRKVRRCAQPKRGSVRVE